MKTIVDAFITKPKPYGVSLPSWSLASSFFFSSALDS